MVDIKFSPASLGYAQEIITRYPEGKHKSALLPLLHLAQDEFGGWLDAPVMDYVASLLHIQPIEVYEVATFYSMYNEHKRGRCLIEVCRTSSCWLMGAEDIVKHIQARLNIKTGGTTDDGQFTLRTVECLGACGYAPMFQVGDKFYENLTIEQIDTLLDGFREEYADKFSQYLAVNEI